MKHKIKHYDLTLHMKLDAELQLLKRMLSK